MNIVFFYTNTINIIQKYFLEVLQMIKKFINYFLILCTIMLILSGCTKKEENNKTENTNNQNTEISRISTTTNITNESTDKTTNETKNEVTPPKPTPVETELGSFSTNIVDKRENRQNNIRITCSKLNGITVESGKTFSFCNTIRKIYCRRRL